MKFPRQFLRGTLLVILFALGFLLEANAESTPQLPGIHNFIRASDKVFSGSQPDGDEAFAALAKLGVTTIVSVDGAKPDVERATKQGLRTIHLPVGYDGIPKTRIGELVKIVATVPGPVYVHCHHGKHRGPAAVAVMCMASEAWTKDRAETFLHQAGTAPEYAGLFRTVSGFTLPEPATLAAISTNFPSVEPTSSLVDAMVAMDEHLENLSAAEKAQWQNTPGHPDSSPAHEALLLLEQLRELSRNDATAKRPESFRQHLSRATRIAGEFQSQLSRGDNAKSSDAFQQLNQSCTACHTSHRN